MPASASTSSRRSASGSWAAACSPPRGARQSAGGDHQPDAWRSGCGPAPTRSGRRFRYASDSIGPWFTVVGLAPDIANDDLDDKQPRLVGVPAASLRRSGAASGLVVRTTGEPSAITPAMRRVHPRRPTRRWRSSRSTRWNRSASSDSGSTGCSVKMFSVFGVDRAAARGRRRVRRDLVQRVAAHAGDRRPRRVRCPPRGRPASRGGAGDAARGDRAGDRARRRVRHHACRPSAAVRRHADRPAQLRHDHACS